MKKKIKRIHNYKNHSVQFLLILEKIILSYLARKSKYP